MAAKTVTTNTDLESVIALGLLSTDTITIENGAILTCTETPSVLIGRININYGVLHIDGLNISKGNVINFVGEGGLIDASNDQTFYVNGQGKLKITGDWFNIGTTNGTASQTIDLSTATGCGYWNKDGVDFCVDVIPMIQVETGRRINYINGAGVTPIVGDFIYKSSDRTQFGKIKEVGDTYVIVWGFSGTLVDGDNLVIRKIVENNGPDLQRSWTGVTNGADIKEADVYMEFGNARSNGVDYTDYFGTGFGGLIFHHQFKNTTLTMASALGGFIPPSGCNIRVPNVIINTSSLVNDARNDTPYANGEAFGCGTNTNEQELYRVETYGGGKIDLHTCNWGNSCCYDSQASKFDASYVGATVVIGNNQCGNRTILTHCVNCQSTEVNCEGNNNYIGGIQDNVNGGEVYFSLIVAPRPARICFGGETSNSVVISDCIYTALGEGPYITRYANYGYYLGTVNGGSITNCMFFGNDSTEQNEALRLIGSSNITIDMFLGTMTQDYVEATQTNKNYIGISNSPNTILRGAEIIGYGTPAGHFMSIADTIGCKIRGIGMIDDKVYTNSVIANGYAFYLSGLLDNIDIARCWLTKTGTTYEEFIVVPTTALTILVQNCSSKYLSEFQPSGGGNTRFKGLHAGANTPGSSEGWGDAYSASYGNNFHDGFRSDNVGTIGCLMISPSITADETHIIAGNPIFFNDGDLDMYSGDIIEFEMGYFAKGHSEFTGTFSAISSTGNWGQDEWEQLTLEFQWQLLGGSWNGTWLDIRTPANWTNITGVIEEGIKLKYRFTANGTEKDMSMLLIDTVTSLEIQKNNFYYIDQNFVTISIKVTEANGTPIQNARVYVTKDVGGDVVLEGLTNSLGIVEDTEYLYTTDEAISGYARKGTTEPYYQQGNTNGTIKSTGLSMLAILVPDS